ncbi:hypothetical protein DFP72DRAFT_1069095 [Ephemerocybe angulata]|uniref:Uncharacterized protein n=1 Tax=Ephemerocybe angulata TaxID=980116 RepID=A0A8H6HVC2_9AGAR|nr:hypothetical protein DFP72DRAFT_1069095 [Tulosesus angulatus]
MAVTLAFFYLSHTRFPSFLHPPLSLLVASLPWTSSSSSSSSSRTTPSNTVLAVSSSSPSTVELIFCIPGRHAVLAVSSWARRRQRQSSSSPRILVIVTENDAVMRVWTKSTKGSWHVEAWDLCGGMKASGNEYAGNASSQTCQGATRAARNAHGAFGPSRRTCEVGCACRIVAQVRVLAVAMSHQYIAHSASARPRRDSLTRRLQVGPVRQSSLKGETRLLAWTKRDYDDAHRALGSLQAGFVKQRAMAAAGGGRDIMGKRSAPSRSLGLYFTHRVPAVLAVALLCQDIVHGSRRYAMQAYSRREAPEIPWGEMKLPALVFRD